jgi:catechol 2,3-dioxygenase-like lactoylglutathione lyase family enzyme
LKGKSTPPKADKKPVKGGPEPSVAAPAAVEARPRVRRTRRDVELEGLKQLTMVWLWVADLRSGVTYYRDQVGLKLAFLDEPGGWALFNTGAEGVDLGLKVWPFGGAVPRGGGGCPVFEVVNLAEARAALEARGIEFEDDPVEGGRERRHATFHDPDGNPIMLTQNW